MTSQPQYAMAPPTWYERRVVLADAIVAILLILFAGTTGILVAYDTGGPLATMLPVISSAALFVRRSKPMLMVSAIAAVSVIEVLTYFAATGLPSDMFVLIAVHVAARYCPKWFGWSALALGIAGAAAAAYFWIYHNEFPSASPDKLVQTLVIFGGLAFLVIASYALGRAQLGRHSAIRRQIASLGEANRLMQIEHEQAMALATEQERARLAAETHDILAHSLAIIVAQADGAVMLADRDPTRAAMALRTIAETSREALAEVRLKVAALRDGNDPHDDTGLAPAKSLRDVPELVESVEAAGPHVDLQLSGPLDRVPAGPALAAYRIVQESLTNVLKHAGPEPHVVVAITAGTAGLDIRVEDDGRGIGLGGDDNGNGLRGMRTRAEQYGGRLDAAPQIGGGFAVAAHIPIPRLTESSAT